MISIILDSMRKHTLYVINIAIIKMMDLVGLWCRIFGSNGGPCAGPMGQCGIWLTCQEVQSN